MPICEICKKQRQTLDKHHIHSRSLGGENLDKNIANICQICHNLVHKGILIIEGRFQSLSSNSLLVWRIFDQESITGMNPKVYLQPDFEEQRKMYNLKYKENIK